jgi:hypothetical protein
MTIRPLRHRRLAAGVLFVFAVLCARHDGLAVVAAEPESIAWREDYSSALDEAKAANRLLWIQFTGPWCPNCTRMERDSFPHPAVIEHSRASFVAVKLRSDVHEQLALSFNLSGLPATIIVAPSREIVAMHQGYLGPAEFDAFLRDSLSRRAAQPANLPAGAVEAGSPPLRRRGGVGPKKEERLALEGYCPVSLIHEKKLALGQDDYTVRHEGWTYRLATLACHSCVPRPLPGTTRPLCAREQRLLSGHPDRSR